MSNHYHLLLETPLPTLSTGAKRLNERYAQHFNIEHRRVGHLFQGRFKAILVEREAHFLELVRYIVLNPVRAGMVRFPGDYSWSSYRATAGLCAAPRWLAAEEILEQFEPGSREERCARYREFVADGRGAEYKPWEQLTGQIYLGGAQFCERMQVLVGAKRDSRAYPEAQRHVVRPSFEAVVGHTARCFKIDEEQLRRRSHHPARKAAALLLSHDAGVAFAAIGDWMEVTGQAAAYLARQAVELERRDKVFGALVAGIRRELETLEDRCAIVPSFDVD